MNVYEIDTNGAKLPATYDAAKRALQECSRVDECKEWADRASALASYAKQAQDSQLEDMARRIKNRALRRASELLRQIEPAPGGQPFQKGKSTREGTHPSSRKQAASDAGFSEHQRKQLMRIGNVPAEDFDEMVERGATATEIAAVGTATKAPNRDEARKLVAAVKAYCDRLDAIDLDQALGSLSEPDGMELRLMIGRLDHIHDRIVTS